MSVCERYKKEKNPLSKDTFLSVFTMQFGHFSAARDFIGPTRKKKVLECKRKKTEKFPSFQQKKREEILNAHPFSSYFYLISFLYCTLRICHINRTKMPVERLSKRLNPFPFGLT